ncbi:NAD-binding protein [Gammaproteobacteria bacterium]|nr:NAD-binding protein [Gammaproteobacteria bacterium]
MTPSVMDSIIFVFLRRMRAPLITLIVVFSIAVLGFTIIPGTDDQGQPYRMDFFHALYFVSYMGSTIGFGELPYPFNTPQRVWTLICIYTSVIAWLYAIGKLLALFQDSAFQRSMKRLTFRRQVRAMREDYWVLCGYGEPGQQLLRRFALHHRPLVVIDRSLNRLDQMALNDLSMEPPFLVADANDVSVIEDAMANRRYCRGVIALTDDDATNLKIAITTRLLIDRPIDPEQQRESRQPEADESELPANGGTAASLWRRHAARHRATRSSDTQGRLQHWFRRQPPPPPMAIIARAQDQDSVANLLSFNTDFALDPFALYGELLRHSLGQPNAYRLRRALVSEPGQDFPSRVNPPRGLWIVCGYGRFGHSAAVALQASGCSVTVIELDPNCADLPENTIIGRGTEAPTLVKANIDEAVGLIAGADHDVNNLSIALTARQLNPQLFIVARQNDSGNQPLFRRAPIDQIASHSVLLAARIATLIMAPLTAQFLDAATARNDDDWTLALIKRMQLIDNTPETIDEAAVQQTWVIRINAGESPALFERVRTRNDLRLSDVTKGAITLMIRRADHSLLLPPDDELLQTNDHLLLYGSRTMQLDVDQRGEFGA